MISQKYQASQPLGLSKPLPTAKSARLKRAEQALVCAGVDLSTYPVTSVFATDQASATIACIGSLEVLVSYSTAVAFVRPDGGAVVTPHQHYSRTTDKSISAFVGAPRSVTVLTPELFTAALVRELSN